MPLTGAPASTQEGKGKGTSVMNTEVQGDMRRRMELKDKSQRVEAEVKGDRVQAV